MAYNFIIVFYFIFVHMNFLILFLIILICIYQDIHVFIILKDEMFDMLHQYDSLQLIYYHFRHTYLLMNKEILINISNIFINQQILFFIIIHLINNYH